MLAKVNLCLVDESNISTLDALGDCQQMQEGMSSNSQLVDCPPTKKLLTNDVMYRKHKFGLVNKPQGQGQFRNGAFVHRDHGSAVDLRESREVSDKLDQSMLLNQALLKSSMQQFQYTNNQIESLKQQLKELR